MKIRTTGFILNALKVYTPEPDKGEKNPYTKGEEVYNPFMKECYLDINDEDVCELLEFLSQKGYDISVFESSGGRCDV